MKKVYILAVLSLMGQSSWARIRDFQTTRLNSTGGAGVGSVLSTESALLNPAASAFYTSSNFSYQRQSTSLRKENTARDENNDDFADHNRGEGYFMTDQSSSLKGGVAYIQQKENDHQREQMTLHGALPSGPDLSFGISYHYLQDKLPDNISPRHEVNHRADGGAIFIIDEETILGVVVKDLTRTVSGEERAIAGIQYTLADRFILIGDVGHQYTKGISKNYLWRAAAQINVFSDLFLRVGRFHDNIQKFKGTGWGVSWIGPRMGLEFAQKISDQFGTNSYIYKGEALVDTSLSAMITF